MSDTYESDEEEQTIKNDAVLTKYKLAGDISNRVLLAVLNEIHPGAEVINICTFGDKLILDETAKIYKKDKKLAKGISFPTCISINEVVCHYSPLRSDPPTIVAEGDLVKVELGVHIDGYAAVVSHSIIVGASPENPATGEKADAILAAHYCAEVALRKIKAGNKLNEVREVIEKVTTDYECKALEGMLSYQMKRNQTEADTDKQIVLNPTDEQKKEVANNQEVFDVHEVYAMDIFVTTGSGKTRDFDTTITVYRRTDEQYGLRMKASRAFYSEVVNKFTMMPFTLRAFEDEKKAKMGVSECLNHELVRPYPVMKGDPGKPIAQFKYTVLVVPTGNIRINGGLFNPEVAKSDKSVQDKEVLELLATSANRKAGGKKKKKKAKNAAADAKNEAEEDCAEE